MERLELGSLSRESKGYRFDFLDGVRGCPPTDWDHCAGSDNPFVSHAFLSSLEEAACVGPGTGWLPLPLVVRRGAEVVACVPNYIKLHSKGEYIFDYHWAEAYNRINPELSYYPKLQVAVPFTPVPGPRLLVAPQMDSRQRQELSQEIFGVLRETALKLGASSVHCTFCQEGESRDALTTQRFLQRKGEQYHWFNRGYQDFDDFLSQLNSRKRKNIKKERQKAASHPLLIQEVSGEKLTPSRLREFFRLYERTCLMKWGQPYLNLEFFQKLVERIPKQLILFVAESEDNGQWVAGAWNLRGDKAIFGRNWGSLERFDCLHFEICYYRAIEYAIREGLERVEAGAQGMHKIQRGYQARPVYSVHHISEPRFQAAIEDYLGQETAEVDHRLRLLQTIEPFKKSN